MYFNVNTPASRSLHADTDHPVKGFVNRVHDGEGQPFTPKRTEPLIKSTLVKGVKGFCKDLSPYGDRDHGADHVLDRSLVSQSLKKPFTPFTQCRKRCDSSTFRVKGWARNPSLRVQTLHGLEVRHGL